MVGAAMLTYGMLLSFVMSGLSRNAKLQRPNPRMMEYLGYVLCGVTACLSALLLLYAGATHLGFAVI